MPSSIDHLQERSIAQRVIYTGRLLTMVDEEVELPDGRHAHREIVQHPGAVAIVATTDDGRIVLVRQWRHALGKAIWEIPAGTREPEEEPFVTAVRELTEETGYTAQTWHPLATGATCSGFSTEIMHWFAATGLTAGTPATDADENLDADIFTIDDILKLIETGETDGKTIAGLALAGFSLAAAAQ